MVQDANILKVGYNQHRLKQWDAYYLKEIAFVETLNEEMKYNSSFLAQLVNRPDQPTNHKYLTEDEEKAVLSTIQWLGTPVGQAFLERVKLNIDNKNK